ncbi:hypothetical protein V5049_13940 [Moellerella wisconsensis]|uniref:hypothetical protein n=1 Tax=Moellerella wisconsensis TaxID=158849 RepID=UPI0030763557
MSFMFTKAVDSSDRYIFVKEDDNRLVAKVSEGVLSVVHQRGDISINSALLKEAASFLQLYREEMEEKMPPSFSAKTRFNISKAVKELDSVEVETYYTCDMEDMMFIRERAKSHACKMIAKLHE